MFMLSRLALTIGLVPILSPAQSAQLLVDINKRSVRTPSYPSPGLPGFNTQGQKFSIWQGKLLIRASDSTTGFEPYVSDGTQAGSYQLLDIEPGGGSSMPEYFTPTRDGKRFFFLATTTKAGKELYVSDGTAKGTQLIDITRGSRSSSISGLTAFGKGRVLFIYTNPLSNGILYSSDGTVAGTKSLGQVSDSWPPTSLFVNPSGTLAFFESNTNRYGREPWVTDGTSKGTGLLKDIYPGVVGSWSYGVTWLANGKGVFAAFAPKSGYELWITDGTTAGTKLLVDLVPGSGHGVWKAWFDLIRGKVLFVSLSASLGRELYVSDGTAKGTILLKDFLPGRKSGMSTRSRLTGDGSRAWLTTEGTSGKVWIQVTDGTPGGTKLFSPRSLKKHPGYMVADLGRVYFDQADLSPGTGMELCVSDGTMAGTRTLVDLLKGPGRGFYGYITRLAKGAIAFQGEDGGDGRELWIYRIGKGTSLVALNRGRQGDTRSSLPLYSVRFGTRALILADDGVHGLETWISDGTTKGSSLLMDLQKGLASTDKVRLGVFGDRFFFESRIGWKPWDLRISDGTVKGTTTLVAGSTTRKDEGHRAIGKHLFFSRSVGGKASPWVSDGTKAGTFQLSKAVTTQAASRLGGYAGYGDKVLFVVEHGPHLATLSTMDLWITDGSSKGTRFLKNIWKGRAATWTPDLVTMGGKVYFNAPTQTSSSDLWVSDFTAKGTYALKLDRVGITRVVVQEARNGRLVFYAASSSLNWALYRSDGTQSGSKVWIDLEPTSNRLGVSRSHLVGSRRLYFYSYFFRSIGASYHRTDGTRKGTRSYDLDPSSKPWGVHRPHMTVLGSQVLISAYSPRWGEEMYFIENGATAEPLGTSAGPAWLEGSDPVQGGQATIRGGSLEKGLTQVLLFGSPSKRPASAGGAGYVHLDLLSYWVVAGVSRAQSFSKSILVPASPSLKGAQFVFQTLSFDARSISTSMRLSNGLHWTLGQ